MSAIPKISVLIPVFNAEEYIDRCLDSIHRQTYQNLQIIVIDDGSFDNSFSVVRRYFEIDNRFEVYSRENRGVAATRNELISKANGQYILFVDADDWVEPTMIQDLIGMISTTGADIAMCDYIYEYPDKYCSAIQNAENKPKILERLDFIEKFLIHREIRGSLWNKLIKSKFFDGIEFNSAIGYGEDAMIMWDILNRATKMVVTSNKYYHYFMNNDSISHSSFSDTKMSVIPVWEYICSHYVPRGSYFHTLAKARFGAETTLLLMEAASNKISKYDKRIILLRKKLKENLSYMKKSETLSLKFLSFAYTACINWALLTAMMSLFKRFR